MAQLQKRPGDIPYVWVVGREHGVNVYFERKNARKCYAEEFSRLRKQYKLVHNENSDMVYAIFEDDYFKRVVIYLEDKTICDYRSDY